MAEHNTSFTVRADINKVYDLVVQHFTSIGYAFESGNRPISASFKRGSFLGITFKTMKTNLVVSLTDNQREVSIQCYFQSPGTIYTQGARSEFDLEVMKLKDLILTSQPAKQPTKTAMSDEERLQLLEDRFLKGEISEETYKEMKKKFQKV